MTFSQIRHDNLTAGGKFFKRDVINFFRTRLVNKPCRMGRNWQFEAYQNPAEYFPYDYWTHWKFNVTTKMVSFIQCERSDLDKYYKMIEKLERRLR